MQQYMPILCFAQRFDCAARSFFLQRIEMGNTIPYCTSYCIASYRRPGVDFSYTTYQTWSTESPLGAQILPIYWNGQYHFVLYSNGILYRIALSQVRQERKCNINISYCCTWSESPLVPNSEMEIDPAPQDTAIPPFIHFLSKARKKSWASISATGVLRYIFIHVGVSTIFDEGIAKRGGGIVSVNQRHQGAAKILIRVGVSTILAAGFAGKMGADNPQNVLVHSVARQRGGWVDDKKHIAIIYYSSKQYDLLGHLPKSWKNDHNPPTSRSQAHHQLQQVHNSWATNHTEFKSKSKYAMIPLTGAIPVSPVPAPCPYLPRCGSKSSPPL